MRLKVTLLMALSFFAFQLQAKQVTLQDAKKVASAVITAKSGTVNCSFSQRVDTYSGDGTSLIYIFHLEPAGFILVSADDASYPVLAYSFEGNYMENSQPENFSSWMKGYADQINFAIVHQTEPDSKTISAWAQYLSGSGDNPVSTNTSSVSPLLLSTWDQGSPYNYLCPEDAGGSGGHVWAGCVATAMSQVLNYWRFPLQGTGSHGYNSAYGYLFADFGNTAYKWEEMTNSANGRNFQMAQLLSHLGISVDMMYSPSGSGAYSEDAANALINNFGMNPALTLEYAPSPIDDTWKAMLRGQLDQGHPMYYHGFGTGGHAFNVDGYNGNDYFHFNWGWSGSFNGYFYLDNLNPGGNNFTNGQGAIINIFPASNYPYYCSSTDTLKAANGTIEDGSGPIAPYLGNSNCGWLIFPDDSITSIKLTFQRFDLQNNHAFLTIYDGSSTDAPVLGTFTGSALPPVITGTTGKMFIKFTSDNGTTAGGWFASYSATKAVFCSGITTLTAPSGSVSDGSGTYNYHENTLCKYKIMPDSAQSITLNFTQFDTFDDNDFIMIFNMANNQLLAKLYGQQNPGTLQFNASKLLLMFHTNASDNAQGWSFDYTSSIYLGMENDPAGISLEVFPNPASQLLNVNFTDRTGQSYSLELLNAQGVREYKTNGSSSQGRIHENIDLSGFTPGVHILRLSTIDGIATRRIIVRH